MFATIVDVMEDQKFIAFGATQEEADRIAVKKINEDYDRNYTGFDDPAFLADSENQSDELYGISIDDETVAAGSVIGIG